MPSRFCCGRQWLDVGRGTGGGQKEDHGAHNCSPHHSSLDTAGAKRETMELVSTHKMALMSFGRVRKSMLKSSEFEYGL